MAGLLKQDFRSDVGYWVHVVAHRFERAMNAELAAEGITYRQFQVLAWLALEGELSQVDLARCAKVEPPTIVRVLDCMERDGLIRRVTATDDRRRKIIRATRKAVPVWNRILACGDRIRERASRGLSDREQATLHRLLQVMHDNLEEPVEAVAESPAPRSRKKRGSVKVRGGETT